MVFSLILSNNRFSFLSSNFFFFLFFFVKLYAKTFLQWEGAFVLATRFYVETIKKNKESLMYSCETFADFEMEKSIHNNVFWTNKAFGKTCLGKLEPPERCKNKSMNLTNPILHHPWRLTEKFYQCFLNSSTRQFDNERGSPQDEKNTKFGEAPNELHTKAKDVKCQKWRIWVYRCFVVYVNDI